jgi:2'-5' RNA ligase
MPANWFIALPVTPGPWFDLQPPDGVRLFGPSDLHLTVAFLGPVTESRARLAFEHAQTFPLPPLGASLGEVECLGSKRRPSAFSALLRDGRAQVEEALGATREQMWNAAEARHDTRPPLAHITLARPTRKASSDQVQRGAHWARELDLGEAVVQLEQIALYTWSEDRAATLFQRVESLPLRAAGQRRWPT